MRKFSNGHLTNRINGTVINAHAHIIPANNDNSPDAWQARAGSYIKTMDKAGIDASANLPIQNFRRKDDYPFDQIMASAKTIETAFPSRSYTFAGVDPRIDKNQALDFIDWAVNEFGCIGIGELACTMRLILPHDEKEICVFSNPAVVPLCSGRSG